MLGVLFHPFFYANISTLSGIDICPPHTWSNSPSRHVAQAGHRLPKHGTAPSVPDSYPLQDLVGRQYAMDPGLPVRQWWADGFSSWEADHAIT